MTVSQHTGAFVIRFQTGTETNTDQFEGRVEHVASSQSAHFHTRDELMTFLERVLIEARADKYHSLKSGTAIHFQHTNSRKEKRRQDHE